MKAMHGMLTIVTKWSVKMVLTISLIATGLPLAVAVRPVASKWIESEAGPNKLDWGSQAVTHDIASMLPQTMKNNTSLVAGIDVQIFIADWDVDTALDGLLVRVVPFDREGKMVELVGRLEASLRLRHDHLPHNEKKSVPHLMLGHWVRYISLTDRKILAYEFRFPLEKHIPADRRELRQYFVTVRIDSNGQRHGTVQQPQLIILSRREMGR